MEFLHIPMDFLAAPVPSYLFEEELSLVASPTAVDNGAKFSAHKTLLNVSSTSTKVFIHLLSMGIVVSIISPGMCARFLGSLSRLASLPNSRSTQSSSWENSFGRSLACNVVGQTKLAYITRDTFRTDIPHGIHNALNYIYKANSACSDPKYFKSGHCGEV